MKGLVGHCSIVSKIKPFKIYSSFEEENKSEYQRRARMSPEERLNEFAILQERAWGKEWVKKPMDRKATWEKVNW